MVTVTNGREIMALRERLDRELGIPLEKEDVLERWQRLQPKPEPRARKLDTAPPPSMAEIDDLIGQRIAAEHERMTAIIAEVIALCLIGATVVDDHVAFVEHGFRPP
jgi:hypothetical protein